jgi:DNA polymerase-3 subunit delta
MQLYAKELEGHLQRGRLASVYLVHGDEPLLVEECCAAIRAAAQKAGFGTREVVTVESGFDWNAFYASTRTAALFTERRLIELRLPSGRPGSETGARILAELAADPPPDVLLVVRAPRLDQKAQAAKWVQALARAGVAVAVFPLEARELPGWLAAQLRRHGLKPGPGVVEWLAHHFEGNLLAAAQEIEKLALAYPQGEVTLDDIESALCDNARFNVYALADACLRGEANAALRILRSLRAEGTEAALVVWALVRELRALALMAAGLEAGSRIDQVLAAHKVWERRKPLMRAALARGGLRNGTAHWRRLMQDAARVERLVKGRAAGEPWRALETLVAAFAGAVVPAAGERELYPEGG